MSKNVNIFLDKYAIFCIINLLTFLNRGLMINYSNNLMTIEELVDYLKVSRRTIYEWLKTNKIPAIKLVGQWRFKKDKIDAWLDSH